MKKISILSITFFALSFMILSDASAIIEKRIATVIDLKGSVQIDLPSGEKKIADVGMKLTEGYVIKTGPDGSMTIHLEGSSETADVEITPNSELRLAEFFEEKETQMQRTLLDLAIGEILVTSKKLQSEKSKFEVKTPTSIVGVRGTQFKVTVESE